MSRLTLAISAAFIMAASAAAADNAAPSYQGDPDTYKVIFEDQNFRVIAATWTKGVTDKPHSHPVPFVTYTLDDCTIRIHNTDGSTRDLVNKPGGIFPGTITASHRAENVGTHDCHAILVERK